MAYSDDFYQKYEHPQVDPLIVGFSGIDPQKKTSGSEGSDCQCDTSNLTEQQKEIVRQIIHDALSVIDFSGCDCDPSKLSDEQKNIIKQIIDDRLQELTFNYDGGNIDDDHKPDPEPIEPIDASDLNHEELKNLLGGDEKGHYHLTKEELLKLAGYPAFSEIKHESLPDLLGGDENGHFHLTKFQLNKLIILIDTFFPDGSDVVIIKPVAPDPVDPLDPYDPYGGLPSGNPPAWEINMLPSDCEATEYAYKMYYGTLNGGKEEALLVQMKITSSGKKAGRKTSDLNNWAVGNGFSTVNHVFDYYYSDLRKAIYYAGDPASTTGTGGGYTTGGGGGGLTATNGKINSLCYSDLLNVLLIATNAGETRKITITSNANNNSQAFNSHLTVNPACAAWHPTTAVFCLTGLEGTSTSYDGETWTLNEDAPHDLRELSYREDLDSFVAWSGEDKTFYASPDGINWKQLSDTPIPLEIISTVHYEPTRQWYCAVGIGDGNAYFSKDLKHWIPTKLRNNSPVDVADVIYMPSTGLFVAMPTSGTYFYTFNPSNWTD